MIIDRLKLLLEVIVLLPKKLFIIRYRLTVCENIQKETVLSV